MLSTRGREEPGCADGLGGVWAPAEDGWLGQQKRTGGLGTRRGWVAWAPGEASNNSYLPRDS